mgnify:CR=1 FL=1
MATVHDIRGELIHVISLMNEEKLAIGIVLLGCFQEVPGCVMVVRMSKIEMNTLIVQHGIGLLPLLSEAVGEATIATGEKANRFRCGLVDEKFVLRRN